VTFTLSTLTCAWGRGNVGRLAADFGDQAIPQCRDFGDVRRTRQAVPLPCRFRQAIQVCRNTFPPWAWRG